MKIKTVILKILGGGDFCWGVYVLLGQPQLQAEILDPMGDFSNESNFYELLDAWFRYIFMKAMDQIFYKSLEQHQK